MKVTEKESSDLQREQLVCDRRQVSSISEMAKEKGHSQTVVAYGAWKVSMSVKNAVSVLGV